MQFPHLFSPITVNGMTLRNRIVMTAMHLNYTPDGEVTDQLVDFYSKRSKGGVGIGAVGEPIMLVEAAVGVASGAVVAGVTWDGEG